MNPNIKVLMYHRIVENKDLCRTQWTCVHRNDFRTHLLLLERLGFTTITFNDYNLFLRGELDLPRKPVILTFDDGYLDTFRNGFPLLLEFGMKGVVFVLADRKIMRNYWDNDSGFPTTMLMGPEHIQEVHANGFEIGSHTMTHPDLTTTPEDSAWKEISHSKMSLEALLETSVRSFAYPYGSLTPSLKNMVADAGYSLACGVYTGPASLCEDPYDIRRIMVPGGISPFGFVTRLITPFERYQWIQRKTVAAVKRSFQWETAELQSPPDGVDDVHFKAQAEGA